MARRTDRHWEEPGDDYTPATDLIFSMFAMTVLLLALFGAGNHVQQQGNIEVNEKLYNKLKEEHAAFTKTIDEQKAKIFQLEKLLSEKAAPKPEPKPEIKPDPKPTPAPKPDPTKPPSHVDDATRQQLTDAKAQLAEALALIEDYRKRLGQLEAKIDYAQLRVGEIREDMVGSFMETDSELAPALRDRLVATIAGRASDLGAIRANRLVFEIHTSAWRGVDVDGSDKDMMDTMFWGEALMRAMRTTSLPVGCLAVMPMGKLHSAHLHDMLTRPGAGKAITDFEKMLPQQNATPYVRQQNDIARALDRRIVIWAQSTPSGDCDPAILATATAALAKN